MKKFLAILMILAMVFSMFACGVKIKGNEPDPNDPTQQEDYDPTDWVTDEDGNMVNINDPEYISKEDENYVSKEDKEYEKDHQLTLEEVEKIPYEEEETALSQEEQRAMNGWGPEDVMAAALPKSWTCSTLNLETLETKKTTGTYKSGDVLIPELKGVDFQLTQDSKMTSNGMNYLSTMAVIDSEIVRFQYSINLNKQRVTEVSVFFDSDDKGTKVYTFTY